MYLLAAFFVVEKAGIGSVDAYLVVFVAVACGC
jgi:hypothetical protein